MKQKLLLNSMKLFFLFLLLSQSGMAQTAGRTLMQETLLQKSGGKIDQKIINSINVSRDYVDHTTGIRHIYAIQKLNGLTVPEGGYSLHIGGNKTMDASNLVDFTALTVRPVQINVTALEAINTVMNEINYRESKVLNVKQVSSGTDHYTVFSRNNSSVWDIPCRMVYYLSTKSKTLIPAWEVQMMDVYKKHYWQAFVDAKTGKPLQKQDLILHCDFGNPNATDMDLTHIAEHAAPTNQPLLAPTVTNSPLVGVPNTYKVYDEPFESPIDPGAVHALKPTAGHATASPDGWHVVGGLTGAPYQYTRGNNVWAFYDPSPGPLGGVPSADPSRTAYNNGGPLGTPVAVEPFLFDWPIDLALQPDQYRNGAIVNLFYWNNLIHDVFYQFGFTRPAGNFESSHNFSTGNQGMPERANDDVLAQAQDGGGTNNANMLTLQDGVNGQMQMYLWTGSLPDSMVQITSSTSGNPPALKRFFAIQGSFAGPASNPNLYTNPVADKEFIIVEKNPLSTVGTSSQGCTAGTIGTQSTQGMALPPGNDVTGKIVLIDRGNCSFVEKVFGAQNGGAAGVIVINNTPGVQPSAMGGTDATGNTITIPAVMVSYEVGALLKAEIQGGATIIGSLKRQFPTAPKRDGDLDNGVIAHEYGHGISSRLTGGPDGGSLSGSEQGGEGWSDFIGLYMTMRTNDLLPAAGVHVNGVLPTRSIGNYVTYQPFTGRGIRPFPYSIDFAVNPLTFQNINDGGEITVPHGVGSLWATMLYEVMQEMIDQYPMRNDMYNAANPIAGNVPALAGGNNVAMRLIIEGMKYQESSPTFVQMRDAILKADTLLYNAQHACRLWKAFAKRGLGVAAVSGTNALNDELEGYNVPLSCNPFQQDLAITKSGPVLIDNGNQVTYNITITNKYATTATGVILRDTLASSLTFQSANPLPTSITGFNNEYLEWTFNIAGNETLVFTVTALVNSPTASTAVFSNDHETTTGFTATTGPGFPDGQWILTDSAGGAYSGTKYWFSENMDLGGQHAMLTTTNTVAIPANAYLVFVHKYATEAAFDGGVVEISTDGGTTWTYLPAAKFTRGSYNGIITTENTAQIGAIPPALGLAAFTGASPGYITSIAMLNDYAGMPIKFRFRMVADAPGTAVEGWSIDNVLVLTNPVELLNSATVYGLMGEPIRQSRGTNARAGTSGFIIQATVVPVGLGLLKATLANNEVKLSWNNSNDANANIYVVERKGTNDAEYLAIGSVPARKLSGTQEYTFTDKNVKTGGQYNYRIRAEYNTGNKQFTNIAFVRLNAKDFIVSTYPNPANDVVNIQISNPLGTEVTYKMFDIMGKSLGTFKAGTGTSISVAMPVGSLSNGTYWIEANNGENTTITKMVISR